MTPTLSALIEAARDFIMTIEQQEAQRRSFAFGNVALSNPDVTRKMIDEAAERMKNYKVAANRAYGNMRVRNIETKRESQLTVGVDLRGTLRVGDIVTINNVQYVNLTPRRPSRGYAKHVRRMKQNARR